MKTVLKKAMTELARRRWKGKTKAEKSAHIQMMNAARLKQGVDSASKTQ